MALTASGTLIVCVAGNDRLRRVDLGHGHVTTIDRRFQTTYGVAHSSNGTLCVAASNGLHEVRSADGVFSRLAPNAELGRGRPLCCHLDEPNGLLCVSAQKQLCTVSMQTAGERRATRIFPTISLWALTRRDRVGIIAPATGVVAGADEAKPRAALSCLMRIRVVGVLKLVPRFTFG